MKKERLIIMEELEHWEVVRKKVTRTKTLLSPFMTIGLGKQAHLS